MSKAELKYKIIRLINEMCVNSDNKDFKTKADKVLTETINTPEYMLKLRISDIREVVLEYYSSDSHEINKSIILEYMDRVESLWEVEEEE